MTSGNHIPALSEIDRPVLSWHTLSPAAQEVQTRHVRVSQFERMAASAELLSPQRARILGILIDAAQQSSPCSALWPIWRAEEIQRAARLAELTSLLDRSRNDPYVSPLISEMETCLAIAIAASYRALAIRHDLDMRPCSVLLRDIGFNLVGLFSPLATSGDILVNCCIERISLPAFKQRALVLIASSLITDMLASIGQRNTSGRIDLALWMLEPGLIQFTVTDYFGALLPPFQSEVVSDLADLLEADISLHPSRKEPLQRLDIVFPACL